MWLCLYLSDVSIKYWLVYGFPVSTFYLVSDGAYVRRLRLTWKNWTGKGVRKTVILNMNRKRSKKNCDIKYEQISVFSFVFRYATDVVSFHFFLFFHVNYIIHCKIKRDNHQVPKIVRVPKNKTNPKKIK